MPPNTVYVGRHSKWGNNFAVGKPIPKVWLHLEFSYSDTLKYANDAVVETPAEAVRLYEKYTKPENGWPADISELKGKNLACWCPLDKPCHADLLLEIANKE